MFDPKKYALPRKWNGYTRYQCPKCPFDEIDINNFKEHLAQHGPRLVPVPEVLSLKINQTEVN